MIKFCITCYVNDLKLFIKHELTANFFVQGVYQNLSLNHVQASEGTTDAFNTQNEAIPQQEDEGMSVECVCV